LVALPADAEDPVTTRVTGDVDRSRSAPTKDRSHPESTELRRPTSRARIFASVIAALAVTAPAHAEQLAPEPTAPPLTPTAPELADGDGEPRLSLPTAADREAWRTSGFRLGLGLVYGQLVGLRGAPSGRLIGPIVRVGLRLDDQWSVAASFQYAAASQAGGLSGLRFAGTLDPIWHVTPSLSVAAGFGFAGIVEGRTGRIDAAPLPSTIETSYTFPDARMPVASCSGVGAAGLVRLEWAYVLGPRAQTSLGVEVVGQWTGCVDATGRNEPDTGVAIVRRQYWPHTGVTLGWGIAWR
jgi:hypothetical protein